MKIACMSIEKTNLFSGGLTIGLENHILV